MNVLLIGLRGAGKTTVGRLAAAKLGWKFVDLDDRTPVEVMAQATAGAGAPAAEQPPPSVAEVWQAYGEAVFRAAEVRALKRVLEGDQQVVALGGGTPMAPGAAELLRQAGGAGGGVVRVVYLRAQPDVLAARLAAGGEAAVAARPSLTGSGVVEEIPRVFTQRDPVYRQLAGVVIDCDRLSAVEAAQRVAGASP
jgi:shikimate kinase